MSAPAPAAALRQAAAARDAARLRLALIATSSVLVLELAGGLLTGSLALLADAGHMLTDAGALALALLAARLSSRPRDARRSYGYGRTEVLAALANGLLLGGVSVAIALEAFDRLAEPGPVAAGPMLAIAVVGLLANLAAAYLLAGGAHAAHGHSHDHGHDHGPSLNVRAAFWHVLGDALGSAVAIAAALCILLWGWSRADVLGGILIAALLVGHAVRLVRESVEILLEGTPRHLDLVAIAREACALRGVRSIHDLHIWTVSSGFTAMSAHVDLEPGADPEEVRRAVHRLLHERYAIEHTTIQTEAAPQLLSIAAADSARPPLLGCSGKPLGERG